MTHIDNKPVCPCCGVNQKKHAVPVEGSFVIVACGKCEAVFTRSDEAIYLGESYALVKPSFTKDPMADDRSVYFDFTCLGSKGKTRRHGWYDPTTKLLTQVG